MFLKTFDAKLVICIRILISNILIMQNDHYNEFHSKPAIYLTSNLYVYIPFLIFLGLFIILVLFYPSSHKQTVDKITKSKDCCFTQQNETFQLDCSVRNPCTANTTCELRKKKTSLSWIILHFGTLLNVFQS